MVLLRSLTFRTRLLLCLKQLPPNLRGLHCFILAGVDAILVETDALACALVQCGVPASRIVSLCDANDLNLFDQPRRARSDGDVCRIVYVGDLEPEAGIIEFLPCVVAWATRNPQRNVEIWWLGEGCLRGVLEAQPIPANVRQKFRGKVSREELAPIFLESDLLAFPVLTDPWKDVISEAITAQLPVLGSCLSRKVVQLITQGVTGWIFDPSEVGAMAHTVDLAIGMLPSELERMRAHAATTLLQRPPGLNERLRRALRTEEIELSFNLTSLGLAS